jgi:DNA-binding transcriptional LysR family regulator
VPPGHALARRDEVRLADLAGVPLIQYSRRKVPAMHAVTLLAFRHAGVTPHVVQECVQVPTAMGLVESGLGVALVPAATARYVLTRVKLLPIADMPEALSIGIALAHMPHTASAPALRFVEVARELAAQTSPAPA